MVNYVQAYVINMFPLPLNMYFELAAFLAAVICWRSLRTTRLRWFLPYLFLIVVAELGGRYLYKELKQPNAWIYNFVVPIEYLFYTWIIFSHSKKRTSRTLELFFIGTFSIYTLIIYVLNGITTFHSNFLLIGSFFMIIFCLLYLLELYSDPPSTPLLLTPMFWITVGLFIFNAGEFSYNLLSEFFIDNLMDPKLRLFRDINSKLLLILYSSFIIGFVCQTTTKYRME